MNNETRIADLETIFDRTAVIVSDSMATIVAKGVPSTIDDAFVVEQTELILRATDAVNLLIATSKTLVSLGHSGYNEKLEALKHLSANLQEMRKNSTWIRNNLNG
jgi:hypothetical protein